MTSRGRPVDEGLMLFLSFPYLVLVVYLHPKDSVLFIIIFVQTSLLSSSRSSICDKNVLLVLDTNRLLRNSSRSLF